MRFRRRLRGRKRWIGAALRATRFIRRFRFGLVRRRRFGRR